jgi:hypothetical protein
VAVGEMSSSMSTQPLSQGEVFLPETVQDVSVPGVVDAHQLADAQGINGAEIDLCD